MVQNWKNSAATDVSKTLRSINFWNFFHILYFSLVSLLKKISPNNFTEQKFQPRTKLRGFFPFRAVFITILFKKILISSLLILNTFLWILFHCVMYTSAQLFLKQAIKSEEANESYSRVKGICVYSILNLAEEKKFKSRKILTAVSMYFVTPTFP